MYSVQKGIIPRITKVISILLPFGVFMLNLTDLFKTPYQYGWKVEVFSFLAIMFFPIVVGLFLASIFPSIGLRRTGININYWGGWGRNVKWEEIDSLVYYPNGYIIIRIAKTLAIFRGLYFNILLAKFVRSNLPILILSPSFENRDKFIEELLKHCEPHIMHKKI